ncbi:CoA transferase [Mycobacterium sp. NPDC003323]
MTDSLPTRDGPLQGLRVIEIAALGPAPFAAMMLADSGAEVLRINRPGQSTVAAGILGRSRTASLTLDLKDADDLATAHEAIKRADVLIEGFRPGVMERLGLGPDPCLEANRGLIYARVTGWGQSGPLAAAAGHDINYLALTGALRSIARHGETPIPPLNLVGDYGGGGMLLLNGILSALYERHRSGRGQVVDAAMIDGATLLMSGIWNRLGTGEWGGEPGTNSIDGGSHFYNVYRTADNEFMAVGSIEAPFYRRLLQGLGCNPDTMPDQHDRQSWPAMKRRFADIFATRTRAQWVDVFAELDACVSPVLSLQEAAQDPHMRARQTVLAGERLEPAPAPRYSRTPAVASDSDDAPDQARRTIAHWNPTGPTEHQRTLNTRPLRGRSPVSVRCGDDARTLAAGIGFTEGPVWTAEARLFVTSLSRGVLFEVYFDGREPTAVAETGSGPNGMTVGEDGRLWITQNGGTAVPSRSQRHVPPSIQVWDPRLHDAPKVMHCGDVHAPSDCAVGPDGALWFTDPTGHGFGPDALPGRVWRFEPDTGHASIVLDDVYFPNGIAFGTEASTVYISETARDRVRRYTITPRGVTRDVTAPELAVATPDGLAVDALGGIWIAGSKSGAVSHFDASGRLLHRLDIGANTMPTSVCFAGADLSTLIVTVAKGGRVLAFQTDVPGLPVPASTAPLTSAAIAQQEAR